jgi:hypothetical protein
MVLGITHGKNKKGGSPSQSPAKDDISQQKSSRTDVIVMKFIEGPKKGEQL